MYIENMPYFLSVAEAPRQTLLCTEDFNVCNRIRMNYADCIGIGLNIVVDPEFILTYSYLSLLVVCTDIGPYI